MKEKAYYSVVMRVVTDPLQLPLERDLGEVDGEAPVLQRGGGREPEPLHRRHHVAYQRVSHGVIHLFTIKPLTYYKREVIQNRRT
jgi:hypothetical protein